MTAGGQVGYFYRADCSSLIPIASAFLGGRALSAQSQGRQPPGPSEGLPRGATALRRYRTSRIGPRSGRRQRMIRSRFAQTGPSVGPLATVATNLTPPAVDNHHKQDQRSHV